MAATKKDQTTTSVTVNLGALLDAGDGAVVTLVAGETQLAAHRAVLVARSPVFEATFRHDTLEACSGRVVISDIEGPVLRELLAYCYTQRVPQVPAMAFSLLAAADKYGMSDLKSACERQVSYQLTVENVVAAAVLAVRHCCPELRRAAVAYVKAHTHEVMATQGWADAVVSHPKEVVEISRLLTMTPAESRCGEEGGKRLIQAAKEGAVEEVNTLIEAGADVMTRDEERSTALHWAAARGHEAVVRRLLEAGAEADVRDAWQGTPLHYAAESGHAAVVRALSAFSADPNARGAHGETPLHWAAQCGHREAVVALLDAGADRTLRDATRAQPCHIAFRNNHHHLGDLLT